MQLLFARLAGFWFICCFFLKANSQPNFITDSLTNYLERGMREWKIPGVAVGIIKNDSIHYINGLGITDVTTKQPVKTNTLFPIWSMGKSFTALALVMLEQQGKINLSLPVKQYLPHFKMNNLYVQNKATTIDLLSHRLGVETFQGDFLWSESTLKTEELIAKWRLLPNKYGLRNGFQYSNFGYLIAGNLIKNISNVSWRQFIQKHIIDSLQMNNSFLQFQQVLLQPSVAKGHSFHNNNWQVLPIYSSEPIQPYGGMYSNITDMLKWLQLHINEGKMAHKKIFDPSIIHQVLQSQNIVGNQYLPNGLNPLVTYALGWDRREYCNKTVYSHGGAYGGFISMMAFVPEEKLGLVILTNADNHELGEAVKWQVIDAYLQINKHNYLQNLLNYTQAAAKEEKATIAQLLDTIDQQLPLSMPLKQFCGSFYNNVYGNVSIQLASNKKELVMQFQHHPTITLQLIPIYQNRFLGIFSHPMFGKQVLSFDINNKKIKGFQLFVHPYVEFTGYYFKPIKKH